MVPVRFFQQPSPRGEHPFFSAVSRGGDPAHTFIALNANDDAGQSIGCGNVRASATGPFLPPPTLV